jgi:hypothetical protein
MHRFAAVLTDLGVATGEDPFMEYLYLILRSVQFGHTEEWLKIPPPFPWELIEVA